MAIPVHLQQFKAAGIYRVVFDKSTIMGVDTEILRLVVGYSEIGPFNIPVYVKSASEFKSIYGDISKKLEKRGIYFHRLALQCLSVGPILCLNLKKFNGETVDGAKINTKFNPNSPTIDTVKINVEDIYDTTRFWELSAEKLINLKSATNVVLDEYISISTTSSKEQSASFIIRKAPRRKLSTYNLSISDWYSDKQDEMPDYLTNYKTSNVADFFAEIYVFGGKFTSDQVLASSTLKNYFETASYNGVVLNEFGEARQDNQNPGLMLRKYVTNAYGEKVDTLDALYNDPASNPIGHYIGSLIPYFKNKKGQYVSLDMLFNADNDVHNMMMSFNTDMLEEGMTTIDLSGRLSLPVDVDFSNFTTSLLGNLHSPIVVDNVTFINNVVKAEGDAIIPKYEYTSSDTLVTGTLSTYVELLDQNDENVAEEGGVIDEIDTKLADISVYARQIGTDDELVFTNFESVEELENVVKALHIGSIEENVLTLNTRLNSSLFIDDTYPTPFFVNGEFDYTQNVYEVVTSIARLEKQSGNLYSDVDTNMRATFTKVDPVAMYTSDTDDNVNDASITIVDTMFYEDTTLNGNYALATDEVATLSSFLSVGDCFVAADGTTDSDDNGEIDPEDSYYDNCFIQDIVEKDGINYIVFSSEPLFVQGNLMKINSDINQEIGLMMPIYLEGYTYKNSKPEGTDMMSKLNWQKFILSALTDYKGLRTALLNKSSIDYRYLVDTFESYVDTGLKNVLSFLAKEKQSAFAILNFPSIKTFIKCPYSAYTNNKGVFNVEYIVKGFNNKKPSGVKFTLPEDADGASFCAFYTPLKFADGYIDTIVPSAGLVSNLFMEKYNSRQPYYIIAGPNYGAIRANELVGPDYNYSQDELQIIEPFGVNCMIYRPGFGTFINANQTAKQTPVSALSKVNVRELVIYLQDEIEKVLQAYQWEFNNPRTRAAIKERADQICARVAANGGIQKYLNVMDESNNTPEIIDNEMAVLSTHIEPGFGCGKMVQELTLYRTGQMASAISD